MPEIVLDSLLSSDLRMVAGYAVVFAFAVVMPGWRSLVGFALVMGGLIGSGLAYLSSPDIRCSGSFDLSGPCGGWLELAIAQGIFFFSGLGLLAGGVTRTVSLILRELGKSRSARIAVTVVGFLVIPCFVVGSRSLREWSMRPPSEACLGSTFRIEVAGATYDLPAAPLFTVFTSLDSAIDRDSAIYYFGTNSRLRAFCSLSLEAIEPVHATRLTMRIYRMERSGDHRVEAFCRTRSSRWVRDLCRKETGSEALIYPAEVIIYSPDELDDNYYGYRTKFDPSRGSHGQFLEEQAKAKSDGRPLEHERIGVFERYSNGYWVAHSRSWMTNAGDPFTLHCSEHTPATLSCRAAYGLQGGARLTYQFHAAASDLEATARVVDRNLLAMISELSSTD